MNHSLHSMIKTYGALVVDDSAVQRMYMVDLLHQAGINRVLEAADGFAGLDLIRSEFPPPALLVVDLEMPGMDGIEMLQNLANENYRPPVMVASATPQALVNSVETMCRELGLPVLGAFSKPMTADILWRALDAFWTLVEARQLPPAPAPGVPVLPEELRGAIVAGQVVPFYQPKITLSNGSLYGMEALARWNSPERGLLSPGVFIPLAEEHGLIDVLTIHLFEAVLAQLQHWQNEASFSPCVAVNLSAHSLSDRHFVDELIERTKVAGILPQQIIIEITESAFIANMGVGLGALGRLRLKGFGLSMDDYGTGFSTTQQLSRLPLTELKIDRSFVTDAPTKPNLRTILASVIQMARDLGLSTLAEGVETGDELRLLKELGCEHVQGFLLAKPMSGEALLPWWQANQAQIAGLVA